MYLMRNFCYMVQDGEKHLPDFNVSIDALNVCWAVC